MLEASARHYFERQALRYRQVGMALPMHSGEGRRFLGPAFRLGPMLCVAAERQVNEVIRAPQVTPFPLTPPWVEGLINLRGQIVPLVHLPLLTGFGRAHVPECLVVTVAGQLYAFRVSSLTGLRYAASEGVECEPAAETAGMPDVFTAFMDEGQLIHRLNFSTLVDSEPFGDIGQTLPTETTVHDG